jgi:hypothetical protein
MKFLKFPSRFFMWKILLGFLFITFSGYLFFSNILPEEEESVSTTIYTTHSLRSNPHKPQILPHSNPQLQAFQKANWRALPKLNAQNIRDHLSHMASERTGLTPSLPFEDATYEWIANLTPSQSHAILSFLSTVPLEKWQNEISSLQKLPEEKRIQKLASAHAEPSCENSTHCNYTT